MLSIGGYVGMYQQQKGLAILYEILFTLFGDFNYRPAKILHVVWWILTILAGYGFLKLNTGQTGIPDAVLCDDAGLFSSFILSSLYLW